jgi:hypothetical protein
MTESWLSSTLQMRFARTFQPGLVTAVVGAMAVASLAPLAARAADQPPPVREQIQFSPPGQPVDSPMVRPRDELLSRRFEFLDGGNSISGVVEPLVAPSSGALPNFPRNTRLLEAFDRKKNWVYARPEDTDRGQTVDEIFGHREQGGPDRKTKTALESFFEDRIQKPARERPRENSGEWNKADGKSEFGAKNFDPGFGRDGLEESNANTRLDKPFDSTRALTAGFSVPGGFFGTPQGQDRLNDFRTTGLNDSLSGSRDDQNHRDKFRALLTVPGSVNPLVRNFDPINLQVDTTRQAWNPVTAPRLGELPTGGGDALNPLRNVGSAGSGGFGPLADPGAKVLGPSSLAPAVAPLPETPYLQPKPSVLEFPRRKF